MSILSLREAIRTTIETEVTTLEKVYTHGGRFDQEQLKRWAVQSPCVVVGVLNIPSVSSDSGQCVASVEWGAFIVASNTETMKRDAHALVLLESVLGVVTPSQRWGDDLASMPDGVKASNLYSGKLDSTGVAIWAVTWTQGYDINKFDMAALDNFLTLNTSVEFSDDEDVPVTEDTTTLEAAS